jgi:glycosyltransferase involved in cell wall biosynthesis
VEFLGFVPQESVLEHMREASMMVMPSTWHEVSALVLTQSMSTHLPAIATATGGSPELIGDGRGFLYDVGDIGQLAALMRTVIDDPQLARATAARAAEFARTELTYDRWVERMRAAYARVGVSL